MTPKEIDKFASIASGIVVPLLEEVAGPLIDQIKSLKAEIAELKSIPRVSVEDFIGLRTSTKEWIDAMENRFEELPTLPQVDSVVDEMSTKLINFITRSISDEVSKLPKPELDADAVRTLVEKSLPPPVEINIEEVAAKAAEIIRPDLKEVKASVVAMGELVNALPPAPVLPDIPAMIKEAVDLIPHGKDGESVTLEDVRPVLEKMVSQAVETLPVPKDGKGLASALINRDNHLILTMTDGATHDLGVVVGKDVNIEEVKSMILAEVAKIPVPTNGKDGLDLKNLKIEHDGEKGFTLIMSDGEKTIVSEKVILPVMRYLGVYADGAKYLRGDVVTWGGSAWHCEVDEVKGQPGNVSGWKLMVKRGRDGTTTVKTDPKTGPVKL